jgi:hypothetical protein
MRYGRIVDNAVLEIGTPIDGFDIADCFAPAIVATLVPVSDDVQIGWTKQDDGSFAAPVVEEVVAPVVEEVVAPVVEEPEEPAPE